MFKALAFLLLPPALMSAQTKSEFEQILDRLDRVESENRGLAAEVRALRQELAASRATQGSTDVPEQAAGGPTSGGPVPVTPSPAAPIPAVAIHAVPVPADERISAAEQRIAEQAQSKVESSQRLPVSLTGMLLFNAFLNSQQSGDRQDPVVAALTRSPATGGATLRQTVVGLRFQGPEVMGGGKVSGTLFMDFFAGSSASLNHLLRLRVATLGIDWKNRSISVGQDKPIVAPREPNSLAQVGVSPLTGAGNLWLWGPQVRFEQRFSIADRTSVRGQIGVYQTAEPASNLPAEYLTTLSGSRPALEGRFELSHRFGEGRKLEIAPGFHVSKTHVLGASIPSNLFTLDWLLQPCCKVEFSGAFFNGRNPAGLGSLGQGFTFINSYRAVPVEAAGGWGQLSWIATNRLSFNVYGGQESDRPADLVRGEITRNRAYAANLIYHIGQNVLAGLEASQVRTMYLGSGNRLNNHYDVGLAYLF